MQQELRPHAVVAALLYSHAQRVSQSLLWIGSSAQSNSLTSLYSAYWQRALRTAVFGSPPGSSRQPVVHFATPADIVSASHETLGAMRGGVAAVVLSSEVTPEDVSVIAAVAAVVSVVHVVVLQPPHSADLLASLLTAVRGPVRVTSTPSRLTPRSCSCIAQLTLPAFFLPPCPIALSRLPLPCKTFVPRSVGWRP